MTYNDFMSTPQMMSALRISSVSDDDARIRGNEYAKIFSRNDELMEAAQGMPIQKTFSGYSETPLLSTQYFNASVASYVSSFAGFMSIERDFDQPNGLFYWFDVLGVTDLRSVIPNLGPDDFTNINPTASIELSAAVTANTAVSTVSGYKIVPGTVRISLVSTGVTYELVDNGQGSLMSVPGVLSESSLNYLNGTINFKSTLTGTATITFKEDVTGTPSLTTGATNTQAYNKRFFAKMQQIGLKTVPDMLVAEYSIASLGAMKKATGSDMATFLFAKLREMYTKTINEKLCLTLQNGYTGDTMTDLDLSGTAATLASNFQDYRSRIDLFNAYLSNVNTTLTTKAVKGVDTTAYVAGLRACNQFQKGSAIGLWEKNTKMSYINDLLGWYNGIPVLRSTDITEAAGEATFYAIHKTQDGQMAPLARGIFMPLTDTPTIGNYNNPTQMASGIYYQEGIRYMAPELVQKVTFKVGL